MKKLLAAFCLCAMTSGAFAQGLVNFFNNANTLVSASPLFNSTITGPVGSWYFALLTSPVGANAFTFTGVYGTNQTVAGRFTGGAVQVAGWAAGTARDFEVFGWSADLGVTFNPAWLTMHPTPGFLGVSAVGWGYPGGFNGTGTLPSLNIFGGATGIQTGFILTGGLLFPEPSAATLAVAGAAVLLIFRRKARDQGATKPNPCSSLP
jgi:hypothetical protein